MATEDQLEAMGRRVRRELPGKLGDIVADLLSLVPEFSTGKNEGAGQAEMQADILLEDLRALVGDDA